MADFVEIRDLEKTYDEHRALSGVNLRVKAGEFVALVGSNGAGKSTLLRCLVRHVEPTAGSVLLDGTDLTRANRRQLRRIRARVGFVFQRFGLVPRCSALQNVLHGAMGRDGFRVWWHALSSATARAEAMDCLQRVGMAEFAGRRADTLSGGQAQRVAIARMLMQRPELVLADEPVASLDPAAAVEVMELLRSVATEHDLTVVAALHQVDFAHRYADRIVGLRDGRVMLDEPSRAPESKLDALYAVSAG